MKKTNTILILTVLLASVALIVACNNNANESGGNNYDLQITVADSDSTAITYSHDTVLAEGNQVRIVNDNKFDIEVIAVLQEANGISEEYDLSRKIGAGKDYLWEEAKSGGVYKIGCRAAVEEGTILHVLFENK